VGQSERQTSSFLISFVHAQLLGHASIAQSLDENRLKGSLLFPLNQHITPACPERQRFAQGRNRELASAKVGRTGLRRQKHVSRGETQWRSIREDFLRRAS
jgi:hypothetical protein